MRNANKIDNTNNIEETQENEQQPKQKTPTAAKIGARKKIEYDIEQIDLFLDVVFGGLDKDEYTLGWAENSNTPRYPKNIEEIITRLESTKLAKACYFGTSSVVKHDDGNLYNRISQFKRLYVVVLDDIGTKIPLEKVEHINPTYIIESSAGNYQYGLVLETPIDDYHLANALVHLVYTSGYSDGGGKMPTKVVRMPCGINGKKGDKGEFEVCLNKLDEDNYWTPQEILDAIDADVTWDEIVEDPSAIVKGNATRQLGVSKWSPIKAIAENMDGIIDPVLEWLYENEMVKHDNGEWVTIRCPWAADHSDGNEDAGYSPLGRGGVNANRRGFHCFHDHCSDKTTREFLEEIATRANIYVPVVDNAAELIASHLFCAPANTVFKVKGVAKPYEMKMEGFKGSYCQKVPVFDQTGKEKLVPEHSLWSTAPNRVTISKVVHDPSQSERLFHQDGELCLNTYSFPEWGRGSYNEDDVNTFKQFIDYLIPDTDERAYFTEWLACKAQNPTFRGAGILMVAAQQGTGRTTLGDMLTQLFTPTNVNKISFSQLCAATEAGGFNEFLESDLILCDEVIDENKGRYKSYEAMKDLIDPRPKQMRVNVKYGSAKQVNLHASFLLMTNHPDAIGHLADDRRIYVINNPIARETPEYFKRLNEWISTTDASGKPAWARSVWRWLQTLSTDLTKMNAPAPITKAKQEMVASTSSSIDNLYRGVKEVFPIVLPINVMKDLAEDVLNKIGEENAQTKAATLVKNCKKTAQATDVRVYVKGKLQRFRVQVGYLNDRGIRVFKQDDEMTAILTEAAKEVADQIDNDYEALLDKLADYIDTE